MKYKKLLIIVIIALFTISIVKPVQAVDLDKIWQDGSDFLNRGKNGKTPFDGDSMKEATDTLYNIFFLGGIGIAAIVGTFLGIKFMTESTEGKAKIKEALIPFCIGCFIIFGGFTIWKITMNLFRDLEDTELTVAKTTKILDEACDAGNHLFDNYSDTYCENCGFTCNHTLSSPNSSGDRYCTNKDCNACFRDCGYGSNGKQHQYVRTGGNSVHCEICGNECTHATGFDKSNNHQHICKNCKFAFDHRFTGLVATCYDCGFTCTACKYGHKFKVNGKYVICDDGNGNGCNYTTTSCIVGSGDGGLGRPQHTFTLYYGDGLVCADCHAPDPNNKPYPD